MVCLFACLFVCFLALLLIWGFFAVVCLFCFVFVSLSSASLMFGNRSKVGGQVDRRCRDIRAERPSVPWVMRDGAYTGF